MGLKRVHPSPGAKTELRDQKTRERNTKIPRSGPSKEAKGLLVLSGVISDSVSFHPAVSILRLISPSERKKGSFAVWGLLLRT